MFFRRAFANKQQNLRNNKKDFSNETFDEDSSNEAADYKHWQMKVQQQKHQEQMRSQYNQNQFNNSVHHNQINYAPHHQTQNSAHHNNGHYQNHSHQTNTHHQTHVTQSNQSLREPREHCSARRGSFGEKEKQLKTSAINCGGGLSVLQLTPIWEHVIRTNALPSSINVQELFEEFYERLFDPEWPVRQHALRVLVDVLIVMGQQADYHVGPVIHPIVDNLGHIAPAVRKGALDALRVYVAQTAMPETVMLDIMNYGMNRPSNDPFSGRLTVAIMLALPALILPILITPKRSYVVKAVMDALSTKMVQITYQEIALKILIKIKDMVGLEEFHEYMPLNVKKDFDLLCKVYGLNVTKEFNDTSGDMHVPAHHDPRKPSKFVPKKDLQGNVPSSHPPLIDSANSKYFGGNYDATYPFERTRLSNNLGTPKRVRSPRQTSAGILRSSSENNLSVDFNGNSSGSESGSNSLSPRTKNNTAANSKVVSIENGVNVSNEKTKVVNGKVIMETEIKITPETAVTMRILEQNPSMQTDDSEDESGTKRIITDFSAPYPVTPMKAKNIEESRVIESATSKNGRRVHFGGEVVKIRTPDSDMVDQSDDNENHHHPMKLEKENSNLSDNSSISSDNSTTNEYIKQANVGFINEPLSLNQLRNNIGQLKEKKVDSFVVKSADNAITAISRATPMTARPVSSRPPSVACPSPPNTRPPNTHSSPAKVVEHKSISSSSSTDYSQELNIRIPEVETVLPAHFTPPSIMIKKSPIHNHYHQRRLATSPMLSPRIITIPPTSSSSQHSSKNNSPIKSAPTTPNYYSPSRARTRSSSPEIRTPIRRSVSSLSPREAHRGVTMLHNLTRSPGQSPLKGGRRNSFGSEDHYRMEEATQTSIYNPRLDEMTQTPNDSKLNDEMTQTSIIGDLRNSDCYNHEDSTPSSAKESPNLVIYTQPEYKSWEELGIVDYTVIKDLKSGDFRLRSRAICAIEDALRSSDNLARVQPYLDSLLRALLTSERHSDVAEDQRRVLSNLISRLPLENLEDRVTQIVTGLCRQGGAGSNLVAKNLMQRLPTAAIVLKLLSDDFLSARSSKFRENALQMVIYALVTFPSTYFDINNCVERTTKAALDRKKRVRQAALDVLAVLGQISSPRTVINVVSQVADSRTDGLHLLAAVKARLARKQLPMVSGDGEVQYALRIPSASNVGNTIMFGSDVEWICSGSGSVSPTSVKNRSFKVQNGGIHGGQQETGKPFEERRIVDGLNRYAGTTSTSSNNNKTSPWSRIPVRGGGGNKEGSSSEDDHGYVAGTSIHSVQRPLESTARFHGKLHSRSFPELSENVKEKQPVRQMSDNQPVSVCKLSSSTKLPVALTKLPLMETTIKSSTQPLPCKNPYSFGPTYVNKSQRVLQSSSDAVFGESIDSPSSERIHLDLRPQTHPMIQHQSPARQAKPKQQQQQQKNTDSPRKSSAKANGNELTIQPLTLTIGLVESDDASSIQNHHQCQNEVVITQPCSKSREINNQDLVENYVEDQTRRTSSGKTNSHILSDNENSCCSTPRHLPKEPTSTEIATVRNEIAQIQSAIQSVKKEMEEIQKQQSANATPLHQGRPPSVNSNKTFVCEKEEPEAEPKHIEVTVEHVTSRAPSAKSILKAESPFKRIVTPTIDVINDDHSSNSPFDPNIDGTHYENEETEEGVSEAIHDEVDHSEEIVDPMIMIRTDSNLSMNKDGSTPEVEVIDTEAEDVTPEISIMVTPQKSINRPPMLKRSIKTTPVKNPMPNINQLPTVVVRPPKVNSVFPTNLRRFERPKDAMHTCLSQLESNSWEEVMEGLKTFVRLIRHHPECIEAQVHLFTLAVAKQVKNLRSQVSRAACSASGEFFMTHAKVLDGDAEELAASLLNRTADTNKFLRADALKALEMMIDALHLSKSIMILSFRGANHQNAAVRCTTAKLLNQLVFRNGCDKIFNLHKEIRDRLILTGANLLMEGSLETRNHTKELFKQLSIHSHYHKILLDVIPSNVYRNIEKALKSIR